MTCIDPNVSVGNTPPRPFWAAIGHRNLVLSWELPSCLRVMWWVHYGKLIPSTLETTSASTSRQSSCLPVCTQDDKLEALIISFVPFEEYILTCHDLYVGNQASGPHKYPLQAGKCPPGTNGVLDNGLVCKYRSSQPRSWWSSMFICRSIDVCNRTWVSRRYMCTSSRVFEPSYLYRLRP